MPSIGWLRAISNGTVHAAEPPSALAGAADDGQGNQQGEQGQRSEGRSSSTTPIGHLRRQHESYNHPL